MTFECKKVRKKRHNITKLESAMIKKFKNSSRANWMVK